MFKKYYGRLQKEGILKSLLCGLTVGFVTLAVLGALFWFMGWESFWICLIVCGVVSMVAVVVFYKCKFQPTTKSIARRVDELGLEERIITMTELEGDTSYIAMRQREDAMKALSTVQAGLLKLVVSLPVIIGVSVSAFFGVGMATVSALGATGVLPSGLELIETSMIDTRTYEYDVVYEIQEGEGEIVGELNQVVKKGENGTAVVAVAAEDYVFISWSDGSRNPYRYETNVLYNVTIKAIFLPLEEVLDGEEDAIKDPEPDGQPNPDAPKEEIPLQTPNSSGKYEEYNQVYDGNTFYGDVYEEAANSSREELASGEYTDGQKDMAGGYLDGIETIVNKKE